MELVSEVQAVMCCPVRASMNERYKVIKKIIESYKRICLEYSPSPVLERVCAGETTFEKEILKLHQDKGFPPELSTIFSSDYNLMSKSKMLDDIIRKIY
jgi:hypothetical protein